MTGAHAGLERRVLGDLETTPSRIPVILGGCGTGRTSLLNRVRERLGRDVGQARGKEVVVELAAEQVRPAPAFGACLDTQYITGLGTIDERMLILIDIEGLMSSADMGLMDAAIAA